MKDKDIVNGKERREKKTKNFFLKKLLHWGLLSQMR
jgi:hypothetical protein